MNVLNNSITQYCDDKERSLRWLARKSGIQYDRLWRITQGNDEELKSQLTVKETEQLTKIIPDFMDRILA